MNFSDDVVGVTTWGEHDGQQMWRARRGNDVRYFTAPRDSFEPFLLAVGRALLGEPIDDNAAFALTVKDAYMPSADGLSKS